MQIGEECYLLVTGVLAQRIAGVRLSAMFWCYE